MKQLNKEQREFLEYIKFTHNCIGWGDVVEGILKMGVYTTNDGGELDVMKVIQQFKKLREGFDEVTYGKPTKYLK